MYNKTVHFNYDFIINRHGDMNEVYINNNK